MFRDVPCSGFYRRPMMPWIGESLDCKRFLIFKSSLGLIRTSVKNNCDRRDNQNGGSSIELFESRQSHRGTGDCKWYDLHALLAAGP